MGPSPLSFFRPRTDRKGHCTIACENIRFSSLFAAGEVSRGGTRETFPSAKSEEKRMFSQARVTISTLPNLPLSFKMVATTILRTRTRFRPPKIRLHCRLDLGKAAHGGLTRALKYCLYLARDHASRGFSCSRGLTV